MTKGAGCPGTAPRLSVQVLSLLSPQHPLSLLLDQKLSTLIIQSRKAVVFCTILGMPTQVERSGAFGATRGTLAPWCSW